MLCPEVTELFHLSRLGFKGPPGIQPVGKYVLSACYVPVTRLDSGDAEVKKTAEVIALKEFSESARI